MSRSGQARWHQSDRDEVTTATSSGLDRGSFLSVWEGESGEIPRGRSSRTGLYRLRDGTEGEGDRSADHQPDARVAEPCSQDQSDPCPEHNAFPGAGRLATGSPPGIFSHPHLLFADLPVPPGDDRLPSAAPMQLFDQSAPFYDAVYAARAKSYEEEAARLCAFIDRHRGSPARTLLDVACGTGEHLRFLATRFAVTGADLSPFMLEVARKKLPAVTFHQADMCALDLGCRFDVVTCLFSAVGYLEGAGRLRDAIHRMAAHLEPGGVVLIEPSLLPEQVRPAATSTLETRVDGLRVKRTTSAAREPGMLHVTFDYVVGEGAARQQFVEHHPMRLYDRGTYLEAITGAGLAPFADPEGISGIGLFGGVKPG
ncbi:MAG: class I SAM-dependent DNA methyltransferase [Acidobacteriota bacterium]